MSFSDTIGSMYICYILDGILILYGIILTILYCRLKMGPTYKTAGSHEKRPAEGGIYAVRLPILMLKKTFKKAHEGKLTAHGSDLSKH
ncbi:high affinity immunoglobulin epsilon receptor subunit gamma-like isoform X1 [Cololabis saira]|uniref:high affinity immunoglobulin epsilon receptor subunit gamma-like isoform X1 n=1 Tax=Cololabis saira TaxID=129043 RepID=UPI002AD58FAD|nr:high affinity immunoglobulin epsilon receptor subunit gamma-like isoform X1 [Cololabis saira]